MTGWLVNAACVAAVAYGLYAGLGKGLVVVALDLGGFILSLVAADVFYQPLAPWVGRQLHLIPSLANLVSYMLLLAVVELVYVVAVRVLVNRIPKGWLGSRLNRLGGAIVSGAQMVILLALGLVIFTALPLSASTKAPITTAAIPARLLSWGGGIRSQVNQIVGNSITDTLNFFTVKPEGNESIALGFTTTNVHADSKLEQEMLALVNHERTSRGLNPLTMNEPARAVARAHSVDMFARGYFSHVTPEGVDPFERMSAGGVRFNAAGENLALAPTLALAHQGLMNSPGHRANILSPEYRTVGIGVIDGGRYGVMITQDFTD